MGIRIHKVMGWGLADVKCDEKNGLIDERFDLDKFNSTDFYDSGSIFIKWLASHQKEANDVLSHVCQDCRGVKGEGNFKWEISLILRHCEGHSRNDGSFSNLLVFDSEYGSPNVIVFRAIDGHEDYRYDDMIDYYEQDDPKTRVKDLTHRCGIFPYLGMEHIPHSAHYGSNEPEGKENKLYPYYFQPAHYNQLVGRWSSSQPPIATGEYLDYLLKAYRPTISPAVILYVYWSEIFKNFYKTIHQLRPMIYTYWG